jgi:hypothetical protein
VGCRAHLGTDCSRLSAAPIFKGSVETIAATGWSRKQSGGPFHGRPIDSG